MRSAKRSSKRKHVRFEGNNYSDEWRTEAERRGLPNLRKTPEALAWLIRPESTEFFKKMGIMQPEENEARYHVKLERYIKDVEIEVDCLRELVHYFRSAHRFQATNAVVGFDPELRGSFETGGRFGSMGAIPGGTAGIDGRPYCRSEAARGNAAAEND